MHMVSDYAARRTKGKCSKGESIASAYQNDSIQSRSCLGIFWPCKTWESCNPDVKASEKGIRCQTWRGKKGYILPPDGRAAGSTDCQELCFFLYLYIKHKPI